MAISLTSTSSSGKLTVNGVDVLSVDATGEVSAKVNGSMQAISNLASLGIGQTWQDVLSSRSLNTTFPNTTGRPLDIVVHYQSTSGSASVMASINGGATFPFATTAPLTGAAATGVLTVPVGASYKVSVNSGTPTLLAWLELKV